MSDPVDATRLPSGGTWAGLVGVEGGIPTNYTQSGSTIAPYTGTAGTIETALAAAADGTFVLLGAGTFNISTDIEFDQSKVELRGAVDSNGVPTTIINFTQADEYLIKMRGTNWRLDNGDNITRITVSSGATRGSTSVVVASTPTGLAAGMLLFISSTLGTAGDGIDLYATDPFVQIVRVTNVVGTTVTFNDPINADYLSGTTRVGYRTTAGVTIRRSGLRNLSLTKTGSGDGWYVDFEGCDECWAVNVKTHTVGSGQSHFRLYGAYRTEIRHCDVQHMQDLTNSTYCIFADKSSAALIVDNYFHDCPNVMPMQGLGGSAFVQNYCNDFPYSPADQLSQIVFFHGCDNHYNLFEMNWFASSYNDPGGSSHNNIWFRNRMRGWDATGNKTANTNVTIVCRGHDKITFAGNVCGEDTKSDTVNLGFTGTGDAPNDSWIIFYVESIPDATFERIDNYNTVDDGVPVAEQLGVGDALVTSYLEPSKPASFGLLPWPWVDPTLYTQSNTFTNLPAGYRAQNGFDPPQTAGSSRMIGRPSHGMRI